MSTIEAIGAVEQVLKQARAPNESAGTQALIDKFESMMKPGGAGQSPDAAQGAGLDHGVNSITNVLSSKETLMNEAFADAQTFSANAPSMSMNQLMAANIDISRRMAIANVGMQSVTALGQASNKSLQSLLKNQ